MRKVSLAVLIILVVGSAAWLALRKYLSNPFAEFERGYADTVLRYKDRNYESAKWEKLKESKSLASLLTANDTGALRLHSITGWDEKNFWVSTDEGHVFRQKDGIWQSLGRHENARRPIIRCVDSETLYMAGAGDASNHFLRMDSKGITDMGALDFLNSSSHREIYPVFDDLVYCYLDELPHLNGIGTVRHAGKDRTEMPEHKYKEAFVHSSDNTPLKDYPVRGLKFTHIFRPGAGFAICKQGFYEKYKFVRFREGFWYEVMPFEYQENAHTLRAIWITGKEDAPTVMLVGNNGWVQVQQIGVSKRDQPLAIPQFTTSTNLILVWGTSVEKYWVMDTNGTIWEYSGNNSRVVVRGLRQDDVEFAKAWVSPNGDVFAINDNHLYRLK